MMDHAKNTSRRSLILCYTCTGTIRKHLVMLKELAYEIDFKKLTKIEAAAGFLNF
jgi:hypothetical protein